jgi:ribosomal protein S18 acetylase RimI-like enzyme
MLNIKELKIFGLKEYQAVLNLMPQLDPGCKLPPEDFFRQILESGDSYLFVAEPDSNEIAGMLTVATYITPSGRKVWIEDVVVDKKHTGKGIGKQLILYALQFAKSLGAESVELTSRPSRVAASRLYQQIGFVKLDTNKYKYVFDLIKDGRTQYGAE